MQGLLINSSIYIFIYRINMSFVTFGLLGCSFYIPTGYYSKLFSDNVFLCALLYVSARDHICF